MTTDGKLDLISKQIAELVRHVAEVRSSNVRLEKQFEQQQSDIRAMRTDIDAMRHDIDAMRTDIDAMDKKIDEKSDFVAGKIEHVVAVFHEESVRDRTRFEDDRYARNFRQRKIEKRLDDVESRLDRLEAK